jgi:DNA-binding Lrp family transcriptional regulator
MLLKATSCGNYVKVAQKTADHVDRRILKDLSAGARITNNELAERVGLSASACLRRLDETGVIQGYAALINPVGKGWTMTAIASIRLSRGPLANHRPNAS